MIGRKMTRTILITEEQYEDLKREIRNLKDEIKNLKGINWDLVQEQIAIYERYKKDTQTIIRPLECVKSNCKAMCSMADYEYRKQRFLNDPLKCEGRCDVE